MNWQKSMDSLQNNFLVAMPNLKDPFFERSVTYICEHNEEGAMGLVINQPLDITLAGLLKQVDIEVSNSNLENIQVFAGGPVGTDRGFVLHSPQDGWRSSLQLSDEVMVTTSKDILESFGSERAPANYLLALGFAGWEAGQLEAELGENSWLTIPADAGVLFNTPTSERWEKEIGRAHV